MDNFINLAKEGFQAYEQSQGGQQGGQQPPPQHHYQQQQDYEQQGDPSVTGGPQYNQGPPHTPNPEVDHEEAARVAAEQAGDSGDPGAFSQALNFVKGNHQQHKQPVDEDAVTAAHQQAYQQGGAADLGADAMGGAAAMQALKMFTSGTFGGNGGGNSQTQLIGLAMSEASKLFDASGGGSGGSKQDAINGAAMTVMKLVVQSKLSGVMGGGDSGGLGGLGALLGGGGGGGGMMMSMVSKLL